MGKNKNTRKHGWVRAWVGTSLTTLVRSMFCGVNAALFIVVRRFHEMLYLLSSASLRPAGVMRTAKCQGLTLVHFSAHLESFGIGGARRGCVALVKGMAGVFRVCRVSARVKHSSR